MIRTGTSLLLTAERTDVREAMGTQSLNWLGVPLKNQQQTIGALVVQTYTGDIQYNEADKDLLQFVSTQLGSAILRKQLHARLLYAAGHDVLTGLANRALFILRTGKVTLNCCASPTRQCIRASSAEARFCARPDRWKAPHIVRR